MLPFGQTPSLHSSMGTPLRSRDVCSQVTDLVLHTWSNLPGSWCYHKKQSDYISGTVRTLPGFITALELFLYIGTTHSTAAFSNTLPRKKCISAMCSITFPRSHYDMLQTTASMASSDSYPCIIPLCPLNVDRPSDSFLMKRIQHETGASRWLSWVSA